MASNKKKMRWGGILLAIVSALIPSLVNYAITGQGAILQV